MANNTPKEPGRFRQLVQLYKITAKTDKTSAPTAIGGAIAAIAVLVIFGLWSSNGNVIGIVAWSVAAVLVGVLTGLILMSRKAEVVAYANIEGRAGAVSAIMDNILRRGWSGEQMPVAVNPKSGEAVYRVSGPGGVVLIAEGHRSGVSRLVEAEKAKLSKAVSGVPVHTIWVCGDEHSTKLGELKKTLRKFPKALNRAELSTVNKRLSTMRLNLPVPKGLDPRNLPRAPRR